MPRPLLAMQLSRFSWLDSPVGDPPQWSVGCWDGVVSLDACGRSDDQLIGMYKTPLIAWPYRVDVQIDPLVADKNYHQYGVFFRESSTGRMHLGGYAFDAGQTPGLGQRFFNSRVRAGSKDGTTLALYRYDPWAQARWFRLQVDGTWRSFFTSADGELWVPMDRVLVGADLVPDQIGFYVIPRNNEAPLMHAALAINSWDETGGPA